MADESRVKNVQAVSVCNNWPASTIGIEFLTLNQGVERYLADDRQGSFASGSDANGKSFGFRRDIAKVANRFGVLRVYLNTNEPKQENQKTKVYLDILDEGGQVLKWENHPGSVDAVMKKAGAHVLGDIKSAASFLIPATLMKVGYQVRVTVGSDNSSLPAQPLGLVEKAARTVHVIPVNYYLKGATKPTTPTINADYLGRLKKLANAVFPIPYDVTVALNPNKVTFDWSEDTKGSLLDAKGASDVNQWTEVSTKFKADNIPNTYSLDTLKDTWVLLVLPEISGHTVPSKGGTRGGALSNGMHIASVIIGSSMAATWDAVHELTHSHGILHTSFYDKAGGWPQTVNCDPDFPTYLDGKTRIEGGIGVVGWDSSQIQGATAPAYAASQCRLPSDDFKDLMGYLDHSKYWVSEYTYSKLCGEPQDRELVASIDDPTKYKGWLFQGRTLRFKVVSGKAVVDPGRINWTCKPDTAGTFTSNVFSASKTHQGNVDIVAKVTDKCGDPPAVHDLVRVQIAVAKPVLEMKRLGWSIPEMNYVEAYPFDGLLLGGRDYYFRISLSADTGGGNPIAVPLTQEDIDTGRIQALVSPEAGSFRMSPDTTITSAVIATFKTLPLTGGNQGECSFTAQYNPDPTSSEPPITSKTETWMVGTYELSFDSTNIPADLSNPAAQTATLPMPTIKFNGSALLEAGRHNLKVTVYNAKGVQLGTSFETPRSTEPLSGMSDYVYGEKWKVVCESTVQPEIKAEAIMTLVKQP